MEDSVLVLSFQFSRAIKSYNLDEARRIYTTMCQADKGNDTDKYLINSALTELRIWDGDICAAIGGYIQVSTSPKSSQRFLADYVSPLTLIGMLERYFSAISTDSELAVHFNNLMVQSNITDETKFTGQLINLYDQLQELGNLFYRRDYINRPSNFYLDLIVSSENGLWNLEYFTENRCFYKYDVDIDNNIVPNDIPYIFNEELVCSKNMAEERFTNKIIYGERSSKNSSVRQFGNVSYVSLYRVVGPFFALSGITKDKVVQYMIPTSASVNRISYDRLI